MPELLGPSVSRQCWLSGLVAAWPQVLAMMAASTSASLQDSTSPMATTTAAGDPDTMWVQAAVANDVEVPLERTLTIPRRPTDLRPRFPRVRAAVERRVAIRGANRRFPAEPCSPPPGMSGGGAGVIWCTK